MTITRRTRTFAAGSMRGVFATPSLTACPERAVRPQSGESTVSVRAIVPHIEPERIELGITDHLRVALLSDPPGLVEAPPSNRIAVCIHAGPPVFACCSHGKEQDRGTVIHGYVDIIPSNTPATWELKGTDIDLVIGVSQTLVREIVMDSGRDPRRLEIRSRFQVRDTQIEHSGRALKAEMETGYPCGRLYMDSLATALATRLGGATARCPGYPKPVRDGCRRAHFGTCCPLSRRISARSCLSVRSRRLPA